MPMAPNAMAFGRSSGEKITGSTAITTGVSTAAPIPMTARAAINCPVEPA